jgi:hypothetical protein
LPYLLRWILNPANRGFTTVDQEPMQRLLSTVSE